MPAAPMTARTMLRITSPNSAEGAFSQPAACLTESGTLWEQTSALLLLAAYVNCGVKEMKNVNKSISDASSDLINFNIVILL